MYNIFAEWSGRSVLEKEVIGMAKREFRLKLIGTILILAFIAVLCWLGIYARKHSYPYLFVDGSYYYFVYNRLVGEPGKQLGTVERQTEYNIYPWSEAFNQDLDSNILPVGTPVYDNPVYPDSVIVYWEEKGNYYNCYIIKDGVCVVPGEASLPWD